MLTDIKSDSVYILNNIAPVNMTPFKPAAEIHPYLDGLSRMLTQSTRANSDSRDKTESTRVSQVEIQ